MSLRTAAVRSIRGVSLYVFADCKVSAVAVNKIQMIKQKALYAFACCNVEIYLGQ